ncbi:MAG: DUF4436 family protein [Microthrixaceae bacterium]
MPLPEPPPSGEPAGRAAAATPTEPSKRRAESALLDRTRRLRDQAAPITNLGLTPWPEERVRQVRNILVMLALFGPVLGLGLGVLTIPAGPTDQVLGGAAATGQVLPDGVQAEVTLLNPDLARGEVTARIVVKPGSDLLAEDGTLTRSLRVAVNDTAGRTATLFETGTRPEPITATLQLTGSRVTRYPLDNYLTDLLLLAEREVEPEPGSLVDDGADYERVPIDATVRSSLTDLRVSGTLKPEATDDLLLASFSLNRPLSVVGFAVSIMGLAWLLAMGCVALAWAVLVRARAIPVWAWGFYAGVLFALPQLRTGLPGSPPYGSIIDWAAYYWALGLVGLSLLALVLAGNLAIRAAASDDPEDGGPEPARHRSPGANEGDRAGSPSSH